MRPKMSAWKKAKKYGVDTTLLEFNLRCSPTERVVMLQNAVSFIQSLALAGSNYYAKRSNQLRAIKEKLEK